MSTFNNAELAWLAGFYEGEGTIGLSGGHIRLVITQKDVWPLIRCLEILGVGKIYGPWPNRDIKRCVLDGYEKAQYAIALIWPWLSPRRKKQAKDALNSYIKLHPNSRPRRKRVAS